MLIDLDFLLSAAGFTIMHPSNQLAAKECEMFDEKKIRRFFQDKGIYEVKNSYFNQLIESRLGLKTLSIRASLCAHLLTHPEIQVVNDAETLRNILHHKINLENPQIPER